MLTLASFSTPLVIGTVTVILFGSLRAETLTTPATAARIVAQLYSSHFSSPGNDLGERRTLLPDHSTVKECIFLIENLKMVPRYAGSEMVNLQIAGGLTLYRGRLQDIPSMSFQ
jgi:hypothetical protein